ncbi:MAG: hypothetical protein AAF726_24720 [Planctomycetota bacterium]
MISTLRHAASALLLAGFVCLAPASAQTGRKYELRYDPPTDQALAMTTTEAHDLNLTELLLKRGDGEPIQQRAALQLRTRADALIADEREPATGRLRRRFLDVAGVVQLVDPTSINEETGEWNGAEFKLTSPSVGVSVAFHPAKGQPDGYGRHFDGKALREPLLPRLAVPFDWSALLPPPGENGAASLELGESFTIRPEVLEPLVAPTGFLPWRGGKRADPQILRAHASGLGGNLQIGFDGKVSGTVEGRLSEIGGDPDAGRYADLTYTFTIELEADRTDFVDERRLEREGDLETRGAVLRAKLEGTCVVRWGLDGGLPVSASLGADETVQMSVRVQPPGGEQAEQTMRMKGRLLNGIRFRTMPLSPPQRSVGR